MSHKWPEIFGTLGATTLFGWICMKGLEGDNPALQQYKDKQNLKKKEIYSEADMTVAVIKGGGHSDLAQVREQTNKRRTELAEKYYQTTYGTTPPDTSEK